MRSALKVKDTKLCSAVNDCVEAGSNSHCNRIVVEPKSVNKKTKKLIGT